MSTTRLLNVIDVEATCWNSAPPPGERSEIIEIGLTVVDLDRAKRVAKHRITLRPEQSSVSAFCTDLTGITEAELHHLGVSFPQACDMLVHDHDAAVRPWASWGDYDRNQFVHQCRDAGIDYPLNQHHTNAKRVFAQAHGLPKGPGMRRALEIAELPLEGTHHRGDDDSWNIAALILHLLTKGAW